MNSQNIHKKKLHFLNAQDLQLVGELIEAKTENKHWALFANCFTCSKNAKATQWISRTLAELGISVFTFDFRGLGESEGDFSKTTLSTMQEDYLAAVEAMRRHFCAPQLLIGHSIGGVISLQMASQVSEAKAVVTLATAASFREVVSRLKKQLPQFKNQESGEIEWGGERFPIRKTLIESLQNTDILESASALKLPLLAIHSIRDEILGFQNAQDIFEAASGPKSLVGLLQADHLFLNRLDAQYAAKVIKAWGKAYLSS